MCQTHPGTARTAEGQPAKGAPGCEQLMELWVPPFTAWELDREAFKGLLQLKAFYKGTQTSELRSLEQDRDGGCRDTSQPPGFLQTRTGRHA